MRLAHAASTSSAVRPSKERRLSWVALRNASPEACFMMGLMPRDAVLAGSAMRVSGFEGPRSVKDPDPDPDPDVLILRRRVRSAAMRDASESSNMPTRRGCGSLSLEFSTPKRYRRHESSNTSGRYLKTPPLKDAARP